MNKPIRVHFAPKRDYLYMGYATGEDIYLSRDGYYFPKSYTRLTVRQRLLAHYRYLIEMKR